MRIPPPVPSLAVLALLLAGPAVPPLPAQEGEEADLRQEIEELKEGQEEMREELQEIKRLLQQQRPAAPARPSGPEVEGKVFDLGANPVKGDAEAALTLVEFSDYQCGFCGRHARETMPRIVEEYVEPGELRYVLLDLPLERIHPLAFEAAEAAHCAGEQDKYWEMHDRLFENQRSLEPWAPHAEALGLDVESFQECLESDRYADNVRRDMAEAQKAGATGTPSFVLARTDPDDPAKVEGIAFIRGAQPFTAFQQAIEAAQSASE